jgi:starch-binding outer membrane protein, SusD/RagB family
MRKFSWSLSTGALLLLMSASGCQDLTVQNRDEPDQGRAISNGDDVKALASSAFNEWFRATQHQDPVLALAVMADNLTASFGNFGMRFNSNEPERIAYNNNPSATNDAPVAYQPWTRNYAALGLSNYTMGAIRRGVSIGDANTTESYKGFAMLTQGASLANLGMLFDKAFIVDETTNTDTISLQPYANVTAAAVAKFDSVIAVSTGKTWTFPDPDASIVPGITLTADRMRRIASTMAARTMVFTARTAAQNTATNWAKVLTYAENGISTGSAPFDITFTGDGNLWYDYLKLYGERPTWLRVDLRVINMMVDGTSVDRWTSETAPAFPDTTRDHRLTTDFEYHTTIPFQVARGVYHFSNWSHKRYRYHAFDQPTAATGPMPHIIQAENDLLIAEALIRTGGDRNRAATLINKTHVTRGGKAPATAAMTDAQLLAKIMYERDVELMNTGGGQAFFDRRRVDGLQPKTPKHLPLPALELETLGLPVYTFGGPNNPEM